MSSATEAAVTGSARLPRLKNRADFLRVAKGRNAAMPGLVLQARARADGGVTLTSAPRVGFTVTRKVGNAVVRNRAKRRLRAVADAVLAQRARPDHDYVVVGRSGTVTRGFVALCSDLDRALAKVHAPARGGGGQRKKVSGRAPGRKTG